MSDGVTFPEVSPAQAAANQCVDADGASIGGFLRCEGEKGKAVCETLLYPGMRRENVENLWTNGIWGEFCSVLRGTVFAAANRGEDITLVYNDTAKFPGGDLWNSFIGLWSDKLGAKLEPSVEMMADLVVEIVEQKNNKGIKDYYIHLNGHSQGAIIVKNALSKIRETLGLEDAAKWQQFLKDHIRIHTRGAASHNFEDVPPEIIRHDGFALDPVPLGTSVLEGVIRAVKIPFTTWDYALNERGQNSLFEHGVRTLLTPVTESFKALGGVFNLTGSRATLPGTSHLQGDLVVQESEFSVRVLFNKIRTVRGAERRAEAILGKIKKGLAEGGSGEDFQNRTIQGIINHCAREKTTARLLAQKLMDIYYTNNSEFPELKLTADTVRLLEDVSSGKYLKN